MFFTIHSSRDRLFLQTLQWRALLRLHGHRRESNRPSCKECLRKNVQELTPALCLRHPPLHMRPQSQEHQVSLLRLLLNLYKILLEHISQWTRQVPLCPIAMHAGDDSSSESRDEFSSDDAQQMSSAVIMHYRPTKNGLKYSPNITSR